MPDEKQKHPFFMRLCWTLNTLRLYPASALLRFAAYQVCRLVPAWRRGLIGHDYEDRWAVGYIGWIEHARLGVLLFIDLDHRFQYQW
jgi:hypothetical protein